MAAFEEYYRSDSWTHPKHGPVAENQSVPGGRRDQKVKMEMVIQQPHVDPQGERRKKRRGG